MNRLFSIKFYNLKNNFNCMEKNNSKKTIGILGGMGPAASANLYQHLLEYAQQRYGAVQDNQYPPIIIYSLPLDGFDETGIVDSELVKQQLIAGVKKLEQAGCDLIIIGCNTVHCFYSAMQSAITVPILNIIEVTKAAVQQAGYQTVGLLASESTVKTKLYEKSFAASGIAVISPTPEQQLVLNQTIEHVMGGNQNLDDVVALKAVMSSYTQQGAQAIVMGCTEIPLAINQAQTDIKLFDSNALIVQAAVDFALQK